MSQSQTLSACLLHPVHALYEDGLPLYLRHLITSRQTLAAQVHSICSSVPEFFGNVRYLLHIFRSVNQKNQNSQIVKHDETLSVKTGRFNAILLKLSCYKIAKNVYDALNIDMVKGFVLQGSYCWRTKVICHDFRWVSNDTARQWNLYYKL